MAYRRYRRRNFSFPRRRFRKKSGILTRAFQIVKRPVGWLIIGGAALAPFLIPSVKTTMEGIAGKLKGGA